MSPAEFATHCVAILKRKEKLAHVSAISHKIIAELRNQSEEDITHLALGEKRMHYKIIHYTKSLWDFQYPEVGKFFLLLP